MLCNYSFYAFVFFATSRNFFLGRVQRASNVFDLLDANLRLFSKNRTTSTFIYIKNKGSEHLFTGPEPACGISIGVAERAIRDRMNRKHTKQWESIIGLKQAKGLISGPSPRRTRDLLKLNGDQLRWIVGLLAGHCHLKGHLFKLGLTDDPFYERCLEEDESATHVLCDCEAIAH
jgi:hypothetical protein